MKKLAAFAAAVAMAGQLVSPAYAAGAFNETTMLGWRHVSAPAAVAYFKMPLQTDNALKAQPRAGLMISSPKSYTASNAVMYQSGSGAVDIGFTGRSFDSPWTASLMVNNHVAWASNPDALPKNTPHLFESGTSWVMVGLLSAGIIAGVYVLADRSK